MLPTTTGPSAVVERRRGGRARKVSERIGKVSETDRKQAVKARLDALENDTALPDANATASGHGGADDTEFQLPDELEGGDSFCMPGSGKKSKAKGRTPVNKRKTRGAAAEQESRGGSGPRSFAQLVSENSLEEWPPDRPSYLTAASRPPTTCSPRKFCSVCGNFAGYRCVRCSARFCSRKCLGVHTETRCLKFIA